MGLKTNFLQQILTWARCPYPSVSTHLHKIVTKLMCMTKLTLDEEIDDSKEKEGEVTTKTNKDEVEPLPLIRNSITS
jgi:hypothetical protein